MMKEPPFIAIDGKDFTMSPFEVKPIESYELPKGKTGEYYPNCCEYHKDVVNWLKNDWFVRFPNCCDAHTIMAKEWWFKKENFANLPDKIITQLSFTEHLIKNRCKNDDWYEDITEYLEYNVRSFGHPTVGAEFYMQYLKDHLKSTNEIPKLKARRLIAFIGTYTNPKNSTRKKLPNTDLNVLFETYQNWLKIFPFNLSFFSHMKEPLQKHLPILKGKGKVNRYSGLVQVYMHSKDSLIEFLINQTNDILINLNTSVLFEKGQLTEPQKVQLELIVNDRKLKLDQGYLNNSKDEEQRYRKIIKEWFQDEKKFIEEIIPLLNNTPQLPQPEKTKAEILTESIKKYRFLNLPKVQELKPDKQNELIQIIADNSLPYQIAMFEYLGFLENLLKNHFSSKEKLFKGLAEILEAGERTIKGNINSMHPRTAENKERYTAHQHKENVKNDYEKLK